MSLKNKSILELTDFESAIFLSLFSNRRIDGQGGGYWADELNDHQLGSRLWSLSRSTLDEYTINQAENAAFEALEWLLKGKLAEKIFVKVLARKPDTAVLNVEIDGKKFNYGYL